MARGSLYYHFGDKGGLFHAVYAEAMDKAVKTVEKAMDAQTNPWDAFIAGSHAYLDLCMDMAFRKITLIESQAAMSYAERFEVQQRTLLSKLQPLIPQLMRNGYFPNHTEKTITIFIYGVLGEIGRSFDFSIDLKQDRKDFGHAFETNMAMLKA